MSWNGCQKWKHWNEIISSLRFHGGWKVWKITGNISMGTKGAWWKISLCLNNSKFSKVSNHPKTSAFSLNLYCYFFQGVIKPDIVFFGEDLPKKFYSYIVDFPKCDLLLIMGTSLEVRAMPLKWNLCSVPFHLSHCKSRVALIFRLCDGPKEHNLHMHRRLTTNLPKKYILPSFFHLP